MGKIKKRLRPKEVKFLEEYAQAGDHAEAYIAAGFRVNSRESARVSGYRLLRKIDERMDYREVLEAVGLTDRRVAEVMRELMEHEDPKVRVQALNSYSVPWLAERELGRPGGSGNYHPQTVSGPASNRTESRTKSIARSRSKADVHNQVIP